MRSAAEVARAGLRAVRAVRTPAVVVAVLVAGCGVQGGAAPTPAPREGSAAVALAEARDAVAFIDTPLSSGSGVLVPSGHVVTSAHVVDPYDEVTVTFEGQDPVELDVVGVDLDADLAVLEAPSLDLEPLALRSPSELARSEPVSLVGYPGEQDPIEIRQSTGRFLAIEESGVDEVDFVATTTPIRSGQSGGALVDRRGKLLGISGLETDDGVALSLTTDEMAERAASIVADGGDRWQAVDPTPDDDRWTFPSTDGFAPRALYLPPSPDEQTITISVEGPSALVAVSDPGATSVPWAVNDVLGAADEDDGVWHLDEATVVAPDDDGTSWTFEIDADADAVITVASADPDATSPLEVTSSTPLAEVDVAPSFGVLTPTEPVEGTLDYFDEQLEVDLDIPPGRTVEIAARSATGDLAWELWELDGDEPVAEADDGGGGLLDLDAIGTATSEEGGAYVVLVYAVDHAPTTLEVSAAWS